MSRAYLVFTAKGEALAHRLAEALPGSVSRCGGDMTLKDWTAEHFAQDEALIFVGAVGIAVRAIAPHCRSKAADPAEYEARAAAIFRDLELLEDPTLFQTDTGW